MINSGPVVLMDIETQSAAELRKVGANAYLRDPTTRLMSAVFLHSNRLIVWVPGSRLPPTCDRAALVAGLQKADSCAELVCTEDPPQVVRDAIAARLPFVAHNADAFDAVAWRLLVGGEQPEWIDTIHGCRAAGLPAGLDAASRALGGVGKDKEGSRALTLLMTARVARGGVIYPAGTLELWIELLRYNVDDVIELGRVFRAVGVPEPDLLAAHRRINARGIPVDIPLVRKLRDLWTELADTARDEVAELTGGALKGRDLDSGQKVKKWLEKQGFPLASLARSQLEAMLAEPEGFFGAGDDPRAALVELVLRARQSAVRTAPGKLDRILASVEGGRVRNCFVYHGAGPGRWTGRELQPHNFPRGLAGLDVSSLLERHARSSGPTLKDVVAAATAAGGSTSDALATLMRPVICAPAGRRLVLCDYASVEARCVAWLARDDRMLAAFADATRDIYCEMASRLFGEPVTREDKDRRQLGKIIVLGCGYQMGVNRFALAAKLGGTDLEAVGVTAEQCVAAFRSEYAAVPVAWKGLTRTMIDVIDSAPGMERTACRCTFRRHADEVVVVLPSGRKIHYRNARIEPVVPAWGGEAKPSPVYTSHFGYRKVLYGGILMENVSQGTCRDLLADAMVQLGCRYEIVMHVHDEIVIEARDSDAESVLHMMLETMSTPPAWAAGFPLACEGHVSERYVKTPLPGSWHGAAALGEVRKLEIVPDEQRHAARPGGFSSLVYGLTRFDPQDVLPESPEEWPYWSAAEPKTEDEEQSLLANISSLDDVYAIASRYGISAGELRRLADVECKVEDEFIAARLRLFRYLRRAVSIPPRVLQEIDDYASPRLALLGVHWDLIVAHLLTTNETYAEAFPFRDRGDADSTKIEGDAADWLWTFYRRGEPKKLPRKDRLEGVLRALLERRREIKRQDVDTPF